MNLIFDMDACINPVMLLMLQLRSCQYQSVIEKRQQQHLVKKMYYTRIHIHMSAIVIDSDDALEILK